MTSPIPSHYIDQILPKLSEAEQVAIVKAYESGDKKIEIHARYPSLKSYDNGWCVFVGNKFDFGQYTYRIVDVEEKKEEPKTEPAEAPTPTRRKHFEEESIKRYVGAIDQYNKTHPSYRTKTRHDLAMKKAFLEGCIYEDEEILKYLKEKSGECYDNKNYDGWNTIRGIIKDLFGGGKR